MDLSLYVTFLLVSSVVIITPGPNVLLVVATSLAHGRIRGLQTVIGMLVAMVIQLYVAVQGTVWLAERLSDFFQCIKWVGVIYLVYLGFGRLKAVYRNKDSVDEKQITAGGTFLRGFFVALTNPKTILFFGAFLPQFTSSAYAIGPQLLLLSASFLVLAAFFDSCYVLGAGVIRKFATHPAFQRWMDGVVGTLFIGAGAGLAIARKT